MWESQLIEEKLNRQAQGAQQHGHLLSHEGGKIAEGRFIRIGLIERIRRILRRRQKPMLRVVE